MKNLAKLLVMALLVGLFGVVAISSLLATSTVATPLNATTSYNVQTGIRWNSGLKVFEVFNASGFSFIASEQLFDAVGNIYTDGETDGFYVADGNQRYNIMQDIAFEATSDARNTAFTDSGIRYDIQSKGIVDGRGFKLENFPIANGSALFNSNAGTIQNIRVINPELTDSTSEVGIITKTNTGIIEDCEVSGTAIVTEEAISIAPIAFISDGIVRSCTNKLDITSAGERVAGIIVESDLSDAIVFNCMNFGSITSTAQASLAGGIAAYMRGGSTQNNINRGTVSAKDAGGILGNCGPAALVDGNKNFGTIIGAQTMAGIVGGTISISVETRDNLSFGSLLGAGAPYPLYNKVAFVDGIKWVTGDVFEVLDIVGFSFIASDKYITTAGVISDDGSGGGVQATASSTYHILQDIKYVDSDLLHDKKPISPNGAIKIYGRLNGAEGKSVNLTNFPIREGNAGEYSALFGTLTANSVIEGINLFTNSMSTNGNTGVFFYGGSANITNCTANGTITTTGKYDIGGFSANGSGAFVGSINRVNISTKGQNAAGFVANVTEDTTFTDCQNEGSIKAHQSTGATNAGGIVATGDSTSTIEFTKTKNSGDVYSSSTNEATNAGGIIGSFSGQKIIAIECENNGKIEAISAATTDKIAAAGGIVGFATTRSVLYACVNSPFAQIRGSGGSLHGAWVGGLAGCVTGVASLNPAPVDGGEEPEIEPENLDRLELTVGNSEQYVIEGAGSYIIYPKNQGNVEVTSNAALDSSISNGIGGIAGYVDLGLGKFTILGENKDDVYENDYALGLYSEGYRGVVMGGIVGIVYTASTASEFEIKDCYNNTKISNICREGIQVVAAGVIGRTLGAAKLIQISGCKNFNAIIADGWASEWNGDSATVVVVAGIIGLAARLNDSNYVNIVIRDCVNAAGGRIQGSALATKFGDNSSTGAVRIGGIAGELGTGSVNNSDLVADDLPEGVNIFSGSIIFNCENYGVVKTLSKGVHGSVHNRNQVGGIVGVISCRTDVTFNLVGCKNSGAFELEDFNQVGGIVGLWAAVVTGSLTTANIVQCINNASFGAGLSGMHGGLIGRTSYISNVISSGNENNGYIQASTNGMFIGYAIDINNVSALTCGGTGSSQSNRLIGNLEETIMS